MLPKRKKNIKKRWEDKENLVLGIIHDRLNRFLEL